MLVQGGGEAVEEGLVKRFHLESNFVISLNAHSTLMCGNNHWIITLNQTRSIQIDSWPGGPKSYLLQPVIASPVIQKTKMEEPQTAVSALLGLVSVAY